MGPVPLLDFGPVIFGQILVLGLGLLGFALFAVLVCLFWLRFCICIWFFNIMSASACSYWFNYIGPDCPSRPSLSGPASGFGLVILGSILLLYVGFLGLLLPLDRSLFFWVRFFFLVWYVWIWFCFWVVVPLYWVKLRKLK